MQPTMDGQDFPKWAAKTRPESGTNGESSALDVAEDPIHAEEPEDVVRRTKEVRVQIKELSTYFRHSYHLLYGQALGMVGSPEVAEDVVQEAFTNTSERIKAGTKITNFNSWLRCCVQNISIKHLRRKPALPLQEELEIGGYVVPVELVHTKQRFEDVCRAIDRLAPAQKSALILAEIRGLAHRDIAEVMNRSEGSVRQLISRARNRVREYTGPNAFSLVLPLFVAASAEARGYIPLAARARIVRSRLLSQMTEIRTAAWQSLRRLGRPAPASTVVAMSVVMVIALGNSVIDDPPTKGSTDGGSPLASSFSAATKAESANAVPDYSAPPSSGQSTFSGAAVSSQAASGETAGSSVGRSSNESSDTHSQGTHRFGSIDFSSGESPENPGGDMQEPVAIIASPNDDRLIEAVVEDIDPIVPPPPPPPLPNPPQLIDPPLLLGIRHVGETVSCSGDTWSNEPDTVVRKWRLNGHTIPGENGHTYTLREQDSLNNLDCYVTATNAGGTGRATTDAMSVIGAPINVEPPTIVGTHVGDIADCTGDDWLNYPDTITYDWQIDGNWTGIDKSRIYLGEGYAGLEMACSVTWTNVVGSDTAISDVIEVTVRPPTISTEEVSSTSKESTSTSVESTSTSTESTSTSTESTSTSTESTSTSKESTPTSTEPTSTSTEPTSTSKK